MLISSSVWNTCCLSVDVLLTWPWLSFQSSSGVLGCSKLSKPCYNTFTVFLQNNTETTRDRSRPILERGTKMCNKNARTWKKAHSFQVAVYSNPVRLWLESSVKGSYGHEKTEKFVELYNSISRAWKVMKFKCGSRNVMENYVHGTKHYGIIRCGNNKARWKIKKEKFVLRKLWWQLLYSRSWKIWKIHGKVHGKGHGKSWNFKIWK